MQPVPPDLPTLHSALSYLMTRYARTGSEEVIDAVIHHLAMIIEHPEMRRCASLEVYSAILKQWQDLQQQNTSISIFMQPSVSVH